MSKTFLITGVSSGLGRAFAQEALAAGHLVAGTVRNQDQIAEFEALAPSRATGWLLEVTDDAAVAGVVDDVQTHVGPVDVLISNAGYGVEGTVEESSMDDLRRQFDVNVFGTVAVIKAVLPSMRTPAQRTHRHRVLHGWADRAARRRVLRSQQVRCGGYRRIPGPGGRPPRHPRHLPGPGRVPHRLGRPLDDPRAADHRRLRRRLRPDPRRPPGQGRQSGRRPRTALPRPCSQCWTRTSRRSTWCWAPTRCA